MQPHVTVYTKNQCQPCRATKKKLEQLGIYYAEINVDEHAAARDYLISRGFMESPVVFVDGMDPWSGYRPDKLALLAGANGAA